MASFGPSYWLSAFAVDTRAGVSVRAFHWGVGVGVGRAGIVGGVRLVGAGVAQAVGLGVGPELDVIVGVGLTVVP